MKFQAYHGTTETFNEFSYEFIGKNGNEHGIGFYFAKNLKLAEQYGKASKYEIQIKKRAHSDKKTIRFQDLTPFVKKVDGYLENWGEAPESILANRAALAELSASNDVDILCSIFNASTMCYKDFLELVTQHFGFDGIVKDEIYVVFHPKQIKKIEE